MQACRIRYLNARYPWEMPLDVQHADPADLKILLDLWDEKHDCKLRAAFEHHEFFSEGQHDAASYVIHVEHLSAAKVASKVLNIVWDWYRPSRASSSSAAASAPCRAAENTIRSLLSKDGAASTGRSFETMACQPTSHRSRRRNGRELRRWPATRSSSEGTTV